MAAGDVGCAAAIDESSVGDYARGLKIGIAACDDLAAGNDI